MSVKVNVGYGSFDPTHEFRGLKLWETDYLEANWYKDEIGNVYRLPFSEVTRLPESGRRFTIETDEATVLAFMAVYHHVGGVESGPRGKLQELNDALMSHFDSYYPFKDTIETGEGSVYLSEK